MPRYQTASQWASEERKPPSGWVSAGTSNFASLRSPTPPEPSESAASEATTHTATRVKRSVRHAARQAAERASARAATRVREVASYAMPTPDSYNAASFVNEHGRELTAIGIGLALAQFPAVKRVAAGILASSAVLGLVVGFAARQTLANGIAGILLAITQPIRIGDLVTFEEETGEVEDVRLTYTYIRLDDGRRLIVPNERLAQSSVVNHTIAERRVQVEVSVWLPPDADLDKAMELIADEAADVSVTVAETD